MNVHVLSEIAAGIAVVATVIYLVMGAKGLNLLREIRDQNKKK